ncbi:sugar transferase (plasmid) [Weissella cibaria]|nr:sugar transferase [Weissella cibaria]
MVYRRFMKRFLDFWLAMILFVILFVPMIIVGVVIKLTSRGPALFVQERYGRNSRPFKLYKFRSMVDTAPEISNSYFSDIKSYITPFGMFIRRTSVDELPQLLNIIKGDMSFIGPRPLASTDDKVLMLRKENGADSVLPGISGLAQVNGRNNITDEDKARYDEKYANEMSFHLDMIILVKTFFYTLSGTGVFNNLNK